MFVFIVGTTNWPDNQVGLPLQFSGQTFAGGGRGGGR